MNDKPKILLGYTTYRNVVAEAFAYQMSILLDGINAGLVRRLEITANMYVTLARNTLCSTAIKLWKKGDITHLLMVDDDVLIPYGGIAKLATHDNPVVGGVYYSRSLVPMAYTLDPFVFYKTIPTTGTITVDGTGGGCLLIRCDILQKMNEFFNDGWWFQNQVISMNGTDKEGYLGEDVFFFHRLNKMGIKPILDCEVQCGHVGSMVVDRDLFEIKHGLKEFKPELIK